MHFVAIDPSEVREVDPQRYVLEERVKARKAVQDKAAGDLSDTHLVADKAFNDAQRELDHYKPNGFVVKVGHIEEAKWIEIESMAADLPAAGTSDALKRIRAWHRDLVRWGIKGHSGFKLAGGGEVPFKAESVDFLGGKRDVVSAATLEIYFASRIMGTLASVVLQVQSPGDDLKNG